MWEDYEDEDDDLTDYSDMEDDRDEWDEDEESFCEQDAYGYGDCMCEMCQYYRNVGQ